MFFLNLNRATSKGCPIFLYFIFSLSSPYVCRSRVPFLKKNIKKYKKVCNITKKVVTLGRNLGNS